MSLLKGPFGRNIDGDYRLLTVHQDKELKFAVTYICFGLPNKRGSEADGAVDSKDYEL
jgi:hypothetical protein